MSEGAHTLDARDQTGDAGNRHRVTGQICDADAAEQSQNPFVHLAKGFAHRAQLALRAFHRLRMLGKALGQDNGSVNGANYIERIDIPCGTGQPVSAMDALFRGQQSNPNQLLQNLRKQGQRNPLAFGDILSRGAVRLRGQVPQGDQPVIRFFGELKHLRLFQSEIRIAI